METPLEQWHTNLACPQDYDRLGIVHPSSETCDRLMAHSVVLDGIYSAFSRYTCWQSSHPWNRPRRLGGDLQHYTLTLEPGGFVQNAER